MKPKSWAQSANLAIEGIIYSVKTQRHMRYHLFVALAVLVLSLVLDISRIQFVLLCVAIVLVLVTEMMNGCGWSAYGTSASPWKRSGTADSGC